MLIKILSKGNTLIFAILCTIIVLVLSLISEVPQPGNVTINDKFGHTVAYMFLSFFWMMFAKHNRIDRHNLLWIVLACFTYGIVIEIMQQTLTSTRTGSVLDVLANTLGITISYFIVLVVKIKVKK